MVARLKIGLGRTSIRSITLLGMLNGLLPCGLVYVASAGAAATGQTWHGGVYMLAFGLGTVPLMAAIGLSSRLIPVAVRGRLQKLVPLSIFLVATLLILRGLALGIPGSPSADGLAACCAR